MSNLLKISDATAIGLHAMCRIEHETETPDSVKGLSESMSVSANHLSKVLQKLVKAGLVISSKGYNGGFRLARPADQITFLEIYEAIEGKMETTDCLLNNKSACSNCIMGDLLTSVNQQAKEYFSKTRLSDFNDKRCV